MFDKNVSFCMGIVAGLLILWLLGLVWLGAIGYAREILITPELLVKILVVNTGLLLGIAIIIWAEIR